MLFSRPSHLALRGLLLLALVPSAACDQDPGACDQAAAYDPVYYDDDGYPEYGGQALVETSCGNGSFCHSRGIAAADRHGAPVDVDLDVGIAVDGADALDRLRHARRVAWNLRGDVYGTVLDGRMPPGAPASDDIHASARHFAAHRGTPDEVALPSLGSPEGREMLRNWLACGVPVIENVVGSSQGVGDIEPRIAPSCPAMQTSCGGACTDTATDVFDCGGCGNVCGTGQPCVAGACSCGGGLTSCGGTCTDTTSDAANCGTCGHDCGGRLCVAGGCSCGGALTDCSGTCVDTTSDAAHCGGCGNACGATQLCAGSTCTCAAGLRACGTSCVDTATDPANCGGCGMPCGGTTPVCFGSTCTSGCPGGTTDCSGACVDTTTSATNCGGCGTPCGAGQTCSGSSCGCASGLTDCGGCVDTTTSAANCGSCGHACGAGQTCTGGACTCGSGQTDCSGTCVDTTTSTANCGSCGHACGAGQGCSGGVCTCGAALTDCGGTCVDTTTDAANCGGCGVACTGGTCSGGTCMSCGGTATLSGNVQPIFTTTCATGVCHTGSRPAASLSLDAGRAWGSLVDVRASCGTEMRVAPGSPSTSYLLNKLTGVGICSGSQMPKGAPALSTAQLDTIRAWICSGALNN